MKPPGRSISAASRMISLWIFTHASTFSRLHVFTASGSFRNIPSPEQGASTSILSKYSGNLEVRRDGGSFVTTQFEIPNSSMFRSSARTLEGEISFATKSPLPQRRSPSCVAFPPGAAHRSSTLSPGMTGRISAGAMALGSCR